MSLSFSSKSRNSSFSSNEDEPCFYARRRSSGNDHSLSVSRPLRFTFTMGSGSSGANTTLNSTYGSSLSSFAGTPFSTPPETPGEESCDGPEMAESKGIKTVGIGFGTGLSAKTEMNLRLPKESMDMLQFQLARPPRALLRAIQLNEAGEDGSDVQEVEEDINQKIPSTLEEVDVCSTGAEDEAVGSTTKTSPLPEEEPTTPLVTFSSLLRAKRPPPLNLTSISCLASKAKLFNTEVNGIEDDHIIEVVESTSSCCSSNEASEPSPRVPQSAPSHRTIRTLSYELPPIPATAPLLTMPKAPRIRPSIPEFARSPSPLTLPSPELSFTLDREQTRSLPAMSPLLIDSVSSPLLTAPSKFPLGNGHPSCRKLSLGQQMATMHIGVASPPIPPSLTKSPLITSPASPFSPMIQGKRTPSWSSQSASPSRVDRVATPMRFPMNPYFSNAVPATLPANLQASP